MKRDAQQRVIIWAAVALLVIATVERFVRLGGPYFERPRTVVDHVSPTGHETQDAALLLPQVERFIPRGADVTVFRPQAGRAHNDHSNYLTAVGLLPRHNVLPPFTAFPETPPENLVEWVVAIREPLSHPYYKVVAGFPNGWLYRVHR